MRPVADQAANALNLFQEILGVDYPHQKLDIVNAVFQNPFSGQSPASIIYLGGAVFRGTGTVAQSVVDSGGISKFMESVVAHEVGHQWWGGSHRARQLAQLLVRGEPRRVHGGAVSGKPARGQGSQAGLEQVTWTRSRAGVATSWPRT